MRAKNTDRYADMALRIRELANDIDPLLGQLGVVLVQDTQDSTNGNGDIAITFPGLSTVLGVLVLNVYGAGGSTVQNLQIPVWAQLTGAPAGQGWARAFSTLTGAAMGSHPVRYNAVGWGVPG